MRVAGSKKTYRPQADGVYYRVGSFLAASAAEVGKFASFSGESASVAKRTATGLKEIELKAEK